MAPSDDLPCLGLGLYFEDLPVGRRFRTIGRTVTEPDIVNFVNATGMTEVLFTNLEFLAEESDIKGRIAPGALGYTFAEGLLVHATMQHTGFAFLEMELKIEGPLFAGDTIHVEVEVIAVAQPPGSGSGAHAQPGREAGRHRRAGLHTASHD
ncbi:MAG: acyl dehydratase [Rhodospirillales bacterium]|nr:acyl dehydratase [Rhodospirillales bacterium]